MAPLSFSFFLERPFSLRSICSWMARSAVAIFSAASAKRSFRVADIVQSFQSIFADLLTVWRPVQFHWECGSAYGLSYVGKRSHILSIRDNATKALRPRIGSEVSGGEDLFRPWLFQAGTSLDHEPFALSLHSFRQRAGGISNFLLKILVAVERFVAGGVGFVIADIRVAFGLRSSGDQMHVAAPVREDAAQCFSARCVSVDDDRE